MFQRKNPDTNLARLKHLRKQNQSVLENKDSMQNSDIKDV